MTGVVSPLVLGKDFCPSPFSSQYFECFFAGGVLDSLFLDYNSVKKLEKMPTKLELIRDAAIMIKKVLQFCQSKAASSK